MFSANSSQVSEDRLYVEDVFSTYLYTGNGAAGASQTITNGIDLAGKGGLVWAKCRNLSGPDHALYDTARGVRKALNSNTTANTISAGVGQGLTAFNSNGFTLGENAAGENPNGYLTASWTFREAPKFFDVVTYTGDGTAGRTVAHNLGVAPGCIIVKRTDTSANWQVYHRSLANTACLLLNTTDATFNGVSNWNSTTPTATEFTLGGNTTVNASGATYVAYLFAHDTTSDGIIQCGSFTNDGSGNATVNLGWEPQWLLIKSTASTAYDNNWRLYDNMRGMPVADSGIATATLYPNTSGAEVGTNIVYATATGFRSLFENPGTNYIYIAIRRGPMRTPTSGTSVFAPVSSSAATGTTLTTGFPIDLQIMRATGITNDTRVIDRLRGTRTLPSDGNAQELLTNTTGAEYTNSGTVRGWDNTGFQMPSGFSGVTDIFWNFRRAPSFFDEVCYTGTGAAGTITHNLGVAPELVITKGRGSVTNWGVYHASLGATKALLLNSTSAEIVSANYWNNTAPTATQVSLGTTTNSSTTFVAYLFASCPGVSKVGSYTGNGSSQTINCGFAAGARFVMIKRTDSTGSWWVWDVARGLVSGNDPALQLNSTAAETTGIDSIDPDSSGFIVNQDTTTNINVSSGTYVYLAIS